MSQIADLVLSVGYGIIALEILVVWRASLKYSVFAQGRDRSLSVFSVVFAGIFVMCSVTHFCGFLAFHWPAYNLFAVLKVIAAVVSLPAPFLYLQIHWTLMEAAGHAHKMALAKAEALQIEVDRMRQMNGHRNHGE